MNTWTIDKTHSEVSFKVRHLVVSTVTGHFNNFNATITSTAPDFSDASITFEADINSVDTRNEQRDGHLRSADFFDAEHFPNMTFVSKKLEKKDDNEYTVVGDLTIRGVTKEVKLSANYNGTVSGFGGSTVAGFELNGKLSRSEFGLLANSLTETGGIVVSDEVKISVNAEFVKQ